MESYENFNANQYNAIATVEEDVPEKANLAKILHDEDFGAHFRVFLIIIGGLFLLDLLTGSGFWFQYVAISWGIGVSCHFWDTYLEYNFKNSDKRDLYMHGAVTATLVLFFLLLDLFTSPRLTWWYYPGIPIIFAWLIHRATVFNSNTSQSHQKSRKEVQIVTRKDQRGPKQIDQTATKRFCANCGELLEGDYKFCMYCGKEIRDNINVS